MPITWALAGLALPLACTAIAVDLRHAEAWAPNDLWVTWVGLTTPRLVLATAMLVAVRYTLRGRTWAMLSLIVSCAVFAFLRAPAFAYIRWCSGSEPIHPLDADHGHLARAIAVGLSVTWMVPVYRALRGTAPKPPPGRPLV